MTDYQPIECGLHSQYELAIMRSQSIWLRWKDSDGETHEEHVQPFDLITQNHEEFLLAKTSHGDTVKIRLDHIETSF